MTSEEEQLNQLKKWWDENGVSTILSVVVAVAAVLGWQGWQQQKAAKLDASAFAYQELLAAVETATQNPQDDIAIAQAAHLANKLKDEFGESGFALFAALFNARQAVADEDYALAEQELNWVLDQNPNPEMTHIATLRLARTLFEQEKYPEALAVIPPPGEASSTFDPVYGELKGDILLAQQEYQQAFDAYQSAQAIATELQATASPLLATKLQYAKSFL